MESHHEIRYNICEYKCWNKLGPEKHMEKKHKTIGNKGEFKGVATSQLVNNFEF